MRAGRLPLLLLLPLCLALSACPYRSDFPVSAPEGAPDPRWSGHWLSGRTTYLVTPDSLHRLLISEDDGYYKKPVGEAWTTRVGQATFLNVHKGKDGERTTDTGYYLYRVDSLTASRIRLAGVSKYAISYAPDTVSLRQQLERLPPIDFPEREVLVLTRAPEKKRK